MMITKDDDNDKSNKIHSFDIKITIKTERETSHFQGTYPVGNASRLAKSAMALSLA